MDDSNTRSDSELDAKYFKMLLNFSWAIHFILIYITYLIYKFYSRSNGFFKQRGVKYTPPKPIVGNVAKVVLMRENIGLVLKEIYDTIHEPYFGFFVFHVPYLVLKSPKLIKEVLVKDFGHFMDRTWAQAEHDKIQKNMMFFQRGDEWKVTRSKLSPVFTSGKLKGMFHILENGGGQLIGYLKQNPEKVDLEKLSSRYVLNGISRCFFGIDAHCLEDGVKSDFLDVIEEGSKPSNEALRTFCFMYLHEIVDFLKMQMFDKKMVKYCANTFNDVLKAREEARKSSNRKVNDMADIIVDLKQNEEFSKNFDFGGDKVLAQPFMFLLAGHGTTTMSLTFTLYHLCMDQDIQTKLRDTINEMIEDYGGIKYEGLMDKKYNYIDMVLADRTCTSDIKLAGTDYVVRKGERILIPMMALHYDEKYFPDPYKFNPERFLDRIALATILTSFTIEKRPETVTKMELSPLGLTAIPKDPLIVDFKILISYLIVKFYAKNYDFFKKRGVKYVRPKPIVGNVGKVMLLRENLGMVLKEIYDGIDAPYFGVFMFHLPYLVLKSPQLIKDVMVKDFSHFMNRTWAQAKHDEIQKNMMFFQHGEEWKVTRSKLSPVFTSGKLKGMFHILKNNGDQLIDYLNKHSEAVDLENLSGRYVLNGIARCFFGINPHCLEEGVKSDFLEVIQQGSRPSTFDGLRIFCYLYHHKLVDLFKLNMFDKKMLKYCSSTFNDVLKTREEARKSGDKILAQPFMFLLAGNGTTTMSFTFACYELCMNPDVQAKLRDTINEMIEDYGGIKYEGLMDKKYNYMDMVLADIKLAGTDYVVRKGERILIPTMALHYDEKYFPEPYKFNPDRFLDRVNEDGYYYVPFGNRFALLNLKIALATIIPNFSIERRPETVTKMRLNPVGLSAIPVDRLIVDFKPLK
nr:unnamed protein product [Callosobruchus chinensis]